MVLQPLTVRAVASADFNEWEPLWKGYNRFYGRPDFPTGITQMTWSRFFDSYEPVYALVAERAGRLVGLAHSSFIGAPFWLSRSVICRIYTQTNSPEKVELAAN